MKFAVMCPMIWRLLMLCFLSRPASALASRPLYVFDAQYCFLQCPFNITAFTHFKLPHDPKHGVCSARQVTEC